MWDAFRLLKRLADFLERLGVALRIKKVRDAEEEMEQTDDQRLLEESIGGNSSKSSRSYAGMHERPRKKRD